MVMGAVSATTLREAPPPRRQRLLEDERWLAFVLLVQTIVLLRTPEGSRLAAQSAP
jgi:multiple sugar transport system permease protein